MPERVDRRSSTAGPAPGPSRLFKIDSDCAAAQCSSVRLRVAGPAGRLRPAGRVSMDRPGPKPRSARTHGRLRDPASAWRRGWVSQQAEWLRSCRGSPCRVRRVACRCGGRGALPGRREWDTVGTAPDPPLLCEGSFATPNGERGTHLPVPCGRRDGSGRRPFLDAIDYYQPAGGGDDGHRMSLDEIFHANASPEQLDGRPH